VDISDSVAGPKDEKSGGGAGGDIRLCADVLHKNKLVQATQARCVFFSYCLMSIANGRIRQATVYKLPTYSLTLHLKMLPSFNHFKCNLLR